MNGKDAKPKTPEKAKVLRPPSTWALFNKFLRIVTQPVPKSQLNQEKPQT